MYESSLTARQDGSPVIGLALGSGAARGWAHIGVIAALEQEGIRPDVVCGCSIGALVGAAYVSGKVGQLGEWVSALDWHDVVGMLDLSFRGGLIRGEKVLAHCAQHFFVEDFAEADRPFACVATELASGREVWLRDGRLADAVRASIALPGLFSPVERNRRVLVDGGLVNPVPVSLCRALGADIVIAVELGSGMVGRAHGRALAKAI
jgi:NTE family protein